MEQLQMTRQGAVANAVARSGRSWRQTREHTRHAGGIVECSSDCDYSADITRSRSSPVVAPVRARQSLEAHSSARTSWVGNFAAGRQTATWSQDRSNSASRCRYVDGKAAKINCFAAG